MKRTRTIVVPPMGDFEFADDYARRIAPLTALIDEKNARRTPSWGQDYALFVYEEDDDESNRNEG